MSKTSIQAMGRSSIVLVALSIAAVASEQTVKEKPHVFDAMSASFSTMLTVRELGASESFYVRYFGFRVTERLPNLRRLERPGISIYLVTESPPTVDKPNVTLAPPSDRSKPSVNLVFRVADVRAAHKALASLGLKFLAPPQQPSWGGWRCFAQDPDGYLIEIEQP
jgi:catechol 2,3-dioxygenase-like lactoylglutathione lyase family enzyme